MGQIKAINISETKGTQKKNIHTCKLIENYGLEGDAHAGDWHRQVSLLSYDKIVAFNELGAAVQDGDFGENLVVEGINFRSLAIGTQLTANEVILEITQIGKECHQHCQIYHKVGDCIMPREGVFARVIRGGTLTVGDVMSY